MIKFSWIFLFVWPKDSHKLQFTVGQQIWNFWCCFKIIKTWECTFEQKDIRASLRLAFFCLMYEFLKLSSNIDNVTLNFGNRTAIFEFYEGEKLDFETGI